MCVVCGCVISAALFLVGDGTIHTLAARGLEELFFQLCCMLCQFLVLGEIGFDLVLLTLMYLEYNTVVMLC
jgi:hypothetical protein